ncbi:signal peptidase II [Xinfangfangia sp. CPCC 101601]|uniref:Lipoprotein signal peptidase n=1 Tax=Pseudogemmobacter lacusdianii TaxID=3069608 RepID=A0ABU0VWX6_9RHOB|nr:signal peptidase II [Xinfangfangia sp. CPCC 101601]MDQ2066251.1 signal peptidase II [Xinfangfangia sp. CPCC 101601]
MKKLAISAIAIFALDQATKVGVLFGMNLIERQVIDFISPYLDFRMAWNRGINFGLLSGEAELTRWLLILVALAISAWVIHWVRKEPQNQLAQVSAGILVGGALGNVVDRVLYGAVADFLNMSCCGFENPYSFNVADIAIFVGAFGLVLFTGKPTSGDSGGSDGSNGKLPKSKAPKPTAKTP